MERFGHEISLFSQSLGLLWLLIPQIFLLLVSRPLYRRKGWRGLAGPAAALCSGFVVLVDYLLLDVIAITGQYLGSGQGRVIYILGSNILNILPYALLSSLLFSYDRDVVEECRRLRGLANPNLLAHHSGKRGILLAMLSFIAPISIVTSPLGLVRSQTKLHGMSKGTIEPRGKGMVVLALGVYSTGIVAASVVFGLIIAGLQFAHLENHKYFDVLYENAILHFPLHIVLRNPWLTVGIPFSIVMIGGFVAQRRYGTGRAILGCTAVALLVIAAIPVEHDGLIPLTTAQVGLEIIALLALAIALWMPQQIEGKSNDAVTE